MPDPTPADHERVRIAAERVCLTAEPVTRVESDETVVVGYRHQTGAIHALIGVLGLAMPKVAIPRNPTPADHERALGVARAALYGQRPAGMDTLKLVAGFIARALADQRERIYAGMCGECEQAEPLPLVQDDDGAWWHSGERRGDTPIKRATREAFGIVDKASAFYCQASDARIAAAIRQGDA